MQLRSIRDDAGISYTQTTAEEKHTTRHSLEFHSPFKGLKAVFSKRTPRENGNAGHHPHVPRNLIPCGRNKGKKGHFARQRKRRAASRTTSQMHFTTVSHTSASILP